MLRLRHGLSAIALALVLINAGDLSAQSMMGGLRQSLQGLLPFLADPDAFSLEDNSAEIQKHLLELERLAAHTEREGNAAPDFGPMADVLQDLTKTASRQFRSGQRVNARFTTRQAVEVCVECHGRLPGKKLPPLSTELIPSSVNTVERGVLLYALREFDVAIPLLVQAVEGYPRNDISPYDLHVALEHLVTHCINVIKTPRRALDLLKEMQDRGNLPPDIRAMLTAWIASLESWQAEPPKGRTSPVVRDAIRRAGEHLGPLTQRVKTGQRFDHNPWFIPILRSTSHLHHALRADPSTEDAAQAAYLLGVAYLSLSESQSFSGLETAYLKSCITRAPGTPVAKQCYDVLSNAVYNGWVGAGGSRVPPAVRKELETWKARATQTNGP